MVRLLPVTITSQISGLTAGLVDSLGDFTDALNAAAALGRTRPRAKFLQPRRTLSPRLMGRPTSKSAALAGLADGLQRMLTGGIYYLDPAYLAG